MGIRIYESNVKESGVTRIDPTSGFKSEGSAFNSPTNRYDVSSPDHGIKMVESSYRGATADGSASSRGPTYGTESRTGMSGMSDSQRSGSSVARQ